MDDYYALLELDSTATTDEIRANYRRLAMKWHPDRNGNSKEAEERFKKVSEAYSVLSDEAKRREYDLSLRGGYGPGVNGWTNAAQERETRSGRSGFSWFTGFSQEQAAYLFMTEMYRLAAELTLQNVSWKDIAGELVKRGCPERTALQIAQELERRRKVMVRAQAKPYFIRSAFSGFFGFLLMGTFAGVGFGLLGFVGMIMFFSGIYNLIRAIYFLTTGKAPVGPF